MKPPSTILAPKEVYSEIERIHTPPTHVRGIHVRSSLQSFWRLALALLLLAPEGSHLHDPQTRLVQGRGSRIGPCRGDDLVLEDVTVRYRDRPAREP